MKRTGTGSPQKLEMNLGTWAWPNRPYHKMNLELELRLKIQSATELAQQNKKLLTAEWAAQVSDREAQQSHLARAPTRCRVTHGVRCWSRGSELVVDRARKVGRSGRVRKVQSSGGRGWQTLCSRVARPCTCPACASARRFGSRWRCRGRARRSARTAAKGHRENRLGGQTWSPWTGMSCCSRARTT